MLMIEEVFLVVLYKAQFNSEYSGIIEFIQLAYSNYPNFCIICKFNTDPLIWQVNSDALQQPFILSS